MLRHVRQCGYEDIGMLVGDDFLRMEHAIESARANGLRITDFFLNGKYGSQPTYDAVMERLKTTRPPAVICCLNDEMAIGCIRALRDCGYRVPEDVSVTGHDDILRANYSEVPLTTVRIYKEEMGKLAVTILRERIRNKRKFSIRVIIPGKLIQRESLIPRKKERPET